MFLEPSVFFLAVFVFSANPAGRPKGSKHKLTEIFDSGGRRRKGSRNKLSENFLETIARDFAEHGAEAIEHVRKENRATYLKILAWLVPRELILQRETTPDFDPAELTDEELAFEAERRRQFIFSVLKRPTIDKTCRLSLSGQASHLITGVQRRL